MPPTLFVVDEAGNLFYNMTQHMFNRDEREVAKASDACCVWIPVVCEAWCTRGIVDEAGNLLSDCKSAHVGSW